MPVIDDKVVAMSFESSKFESGVNKTLASIEKLKAAIQFPHAGKGLLAFGHAAKQVDLGHIGKGMEGIKAHLGALNVAAVAVFANIAGKAVALGAQLAKTFTIEPVSTGFKEYTTQLNAVQTIMANTQAAGVTLKEVNATLKELNDYSDKTIYNFGQMARNIGTFTAAGVALEPATAAIKGIANLAALSGSNAEQASTAMYQLSQAISAGSVKMIDWNSVVNAGMGGTVFQRALAQTAVKMGTLEEKAVKLTGPMKNVSVHGEAFRQSLSVPGKASWLTSDVLTKTLAQFTGDLSDAELAAQGFSDAEIVAIQKMAKTAQAAATEVKTLPQVFTVAIETAGSGWAQTFQIIFGTFTQAKKTFTELSNTINNFINTNADARNKVLRHWKALGGRALLIDSIRTAFHNLSAVVAPIKDAFRDIFPAKTGKDLYNMTVQFSKFVAKLKPSQATVEDLRRTFRGLFAVFSIARQIIGGILGVFGKLFGAIGDGSGSFLNFTGNIGDFLVSVDQALKKGDRLNKFFDKLGDILAVPIEKFGELKDAVADLFSDFDSGGVSAKLSPIQKILEAIGELLDKVLAQMGELGTIVAPLVQSYIAFFAEVGQAIVKALSNLNFEAVLAVVRTGLFAGIFLMFKKFLGKGSLLDQFSKGFAGGIMANISRSFGALSGSMQALQGTMVGLQQNLKAKTLKEIALAIALLAVSVLAISLVDPKRLSSSLSAITVMFGQLLGAMAILNKVVASAGFIKLPLVAASLILLAGAINVLTLSVVALSFLSWDSLLKGLSGVAAMMTTMVVAAGPLSATGPGLIRAGAGMLVIAVALRIMANAVKAFSEMNLSELAKGLGSVATSLAIVVRVSSGFTKGMAAAGAGLILIAAGLRILAESVAKFGGMDMATIGKGMLGIGASLVIIAVAMNLMPKGMILQAAGLLLVAAALQGIARAVGIMGGMSLEDLGKGLGALAVALTLLGLALIVMQGSFAGAASLTLAAAGIAILAGALQTMGSMSWMSIIKSMIVLASALTLIGVAGLLITPVIPSLLGLGAALLLIGAGLALAGVGIALIGAGLSALVVAAPSGFGILLAAVVQFQQGLIETIKLFILGLVEIVQAIAEVAPQLVDSLVKILAQVIIAITQLAPKLIPLIDVLINVLVTALANNQDKLTKAFFDLIIAILQGLRNSIGEIARLVVEIIAELVGGLARNINKLVTAGAQLITAFLRGIADGFSGVTRTAISIITKFLSAIASNLGRIVTAGLSILTKFLRAIAGGLGKVITAGTDVIVAFINGVGNAGPRIVTAATNAIIKFINALSQNSVKLADAGMKAIIAFLNGIADAINTNAPAMRQAGIRVGLAIVDGMTFGLVSKGRELLSKAADLANKVKDKLKGAFGIKSPSKFAEEVGQNVILGLANGLSENAKAVDAASAMSNGIITTVEDIFEIASASKVMKRIGNQITAGLAEGIKLGTEEDIKQSFVDINTLLAEEIARAKQIMAEARAARRAERDKKPKERNKAVIDQATESINKQSEAIRKLTNYHTRFNKALTEQKGQLAGYGKQLAELNKDLEIAQGIFESFKEQFTELPEFKLEDEEGNALEDPLGAFMTSLGDTVGATEKFAGSMATLKDMGLDDKTYEALLRAGPAAQKFVDQLIAGGPAAVTAINNMNIRLNTAATTLGNNAAAKLYDAGKQAAAGFVSGLTTEIENLKTKMGTLATTIVNVIKGKLKIKSPSEVFAEIGKLSMEGMAKGFDDSSRIVTAAVDDAAADALEAMRLSMRDISDLITDELNPEPTITPILDLTQVRSKAAELAALTGPVPLTASALAASISTNQAVPGEQITATDRAAVKFEQNNYSPTALSEVEIYRQTKNQLSQLKSALALT